MLTTWMGWLSGWMVQYAKDMMQFLDTPGSISEESLASFPASPNYNLDDYLQPRGGWKTSNKLFARNFKLGYRLVAAIPDPTMVASSADSTFDGQWEVRSDPGVTIKNIHWKISELLEGSPYKDHFNNGIFMHAFLSPADYHRQHAPVRGKALEARVIPGQVYLEVFAQETVAGTLTLAPKRKFHHESGIPAFKTEVGEMVFDAPDNAGYQFVQTRGLIVLETAIGFVAVLPLGMAQVSSVILTAEVGKGEELSYFQFGGSDIVPLFEARSNVSITAQVGTHYKIGTRIAQAFPGPESLT